MTYVAGIDGGQSGTQAAVADETGRVLGYGSAGPADEVGVAADSTRMHDALRDALAGACHAAKLDEATSFAAIVAGVSGYEGSVRGVTPALPTRRLLLMHDGAVAQVGAFAGGDGVVVIAGTGSVAYGVVDGTTRVAGGWGYLFGDEGSAYWIARRALSRAMRQGDDAVGRKALAFFDVPDLRALARRYYMGEISRDRLAAFAPVALQGDDALLRDAAEELAALALAPLSPAQTAVPFAFVGGVASDARMREAIARALHERCPSAKIVDAAYPPVLGAVLLAMREAGIRCERLSA